MTKLTAEQQSDIVALYKGASMTTEAIAARFNVSPRQVQRIAKKHRVNRTIARSNKLMAKYKDYSSLRVAVKAGRKHLSRKQRYAVLSSQPWCSTCGARPPEVALQVDHIDGDATNNVESNLHVLCILCNQGKR